MKKIPLVIFFGIILFNPTLFSIKNEPFNGNKIEQNAISKADKAKIVAASLGCFIFAIASLMSYPTYNLIHKLPIEERRKLKISVLHYLSMIAATIANGPFHCLPKNWRASLASNNKCLCYITYPIGSIASGTLACFLGSYAYKKISNLR